jgi:hypothetical protein
VLDLLTTGRATEFLTMVRIFIYNIHFPTLDRSKDYLETEDLIVKAKYAMFGKALVR